MAFPFAALQFLSRVCAVRTILDIMSWNHSWSRNNSWSSSSWQDDSNSTPTWNNWGRQHTSTQPKVPENPVTSPQTFKPDHECYNGAPWLGHPVVGVSASTVGLRRPCKTCELQMLDRSIRTCAAGLRLPVRPANRTRSPVNF